MRARAWWRAGLARLMVVGCVVALAALCVPASPLSVVGAQAGADANEDAFSSVAARRISAGGSHTCMILADGAVRCWGRAREGQLGYGNTNDIGDNERPDSVGPVNLGAGRRAIDIAAGFHHTCVILDNGSVKCWGDSSNGELGYGNTNRIGDNETPASVGTVDLGPGRTALAITAGRRHTCAILDDRSLRCWGDSNFGVLGSPGGPSIGDNETPGSVPPVSLGGALGRPPALAVAAGNSHTCAIFDPEPDPRLFCWGNTGDGKLGLGFISDTTSRPASVNLLPAIPVAISAADRHTCVILNFGSVRCWGSGEDGRLGDRGHFRDRFNAVHFNNIGDDEVPGSVRTVDLGAGRTATAISAGDAHTCAILDNRQVRCWGRGRDGQLGYANTASIGDFEVPGSVGPVNIRAGQGAVAITTAENHTCARMSDATVSCWGRGLTGRLGYGNTNNIGDTETPASAGPVAVGNQPLASVSVVADQAAVSVGASIDYHVTVTNAGALALSGVTVAVPNATACEQPVPDLGIGESFTIDCSYVTTPADVGTHVTAATVDTDQTDPVESAPVEVAVNDDPAPAVAVSVTADQDVVESGGDIGFHVAVANRGNVDLTGVVVTDPAATACEQPVPDLGVGERFVIDCVRTTGPDDIGTLTNVATVDSDQTEPADSAGVDVRVTPALQPDLAVRKAGGVAIGDGVYNRDGAGQTRTSRRAPGETATFYVPITNDGQGADTFDVRPNGAHPGVSVRWFAQRFGREITAAVDAGTYRTVELAPGQTTIVRVEVTVDASAARGTIPTVTVRARSHTTPSRLDTVKAAVQVR